MCVEIQHKFESLALNPIYVLNHLKHLRINLSVRQGNLKLKKSRYFASG